MQPVLTENRRKKHRALARVQDIGGMLELKSTRQWQPLVIKNLSDNGLCIMSASHIERGENVSVMITHPYRVQVSCKVVWSKKTKEGCMVGLVNINDGKRLQSLHYEIVNKEIQSKYDKTG